MRAGAILERASLYTKSFGRSINLMQKRVDKIKVLQVVEDFKIGGLERVVENIFDGLDRDIYEPSLWCIAGGGKLADEFIMERKDIRILNLRTYHNPLNILKLAYLLRKERYHIVHTHGYYASTMGRISALLARVPIIITHVHTTNWNFKKRNILIEKLLSEVTDKIICCSHAVREFVVSFEKIKRDKAIVIYNGISCGKLGVVRKKEDTEAAVRIAVIASLVKNKGHRYLIEAFRKVGIRNESIRLLIVGGGPLDDELRGYAGSLAVKDKIDFLGIQEDVHGILECSDILVLPSVEREGLGISIIEAMCHGRPVIASNIGGIRELVQDDVNGYLVEPGNSDELAKKLEMLITDNRRREQMGDAGRKIFEEKFAADIMMNGIETLYGKMLGLLR